MRVVRVMRLLDLPFFPAGADDFGVQCETPCCTGRFRKAGEGHDPTSAAKLVSAEQTMFTKKLTN
jgi:hypothetical protein